MSTLKKEIIKAAMCPVEVIDPDTAAGRYRFPATFVGFSGHFPNYPVLPAFVQVMTALTVFEEWRGRPSRLASIEKAKFHIELRPDQEITVQCRQYVSKGKAMVEARLSVAEGLAASLSMKFEEP